MMRSTMNHNDDDDDFAPNPFRSGGGGSDLLDSPPPQQQPSQYGSPQQQQFGSPQQQQQFGSYSDNNNFQQQQQQQQFYSQPDPNSGMTGTFQPQPPPPQQQQQQQQYNPSQYLSGPMDQGANNGSSVGQTNPNQTASIFSWRGLMSCFRIDDSILRLFDIDSIDIYVRLKGSILKFHEPDVFRTSIIGDTQAQEAANAGTISSPSEANNVPIADRKGPDLYGPFWISMTLIFILGVTANLSDYMRHRKKHANNPEEEFESDINHLLHATTIVMLFSFGIPTLFWLACQCLGMSAISWSMWVCCYGYSLTSILIGVCIVWLLPYGLWHWLILAISVSISGLLVVRNLSTPLLSQDTHNHTKAAPILLAMLAIHFIYLLVLKSTFYHAK